MAIAPVSNPFDSPIYKQLSGATPAGNTQQPAGLDSPEYKQLSGADAPAMQVAGFDSPEYKQLMGEDVAADETTAEPAEEAAQTPQADVEKINQFRREPVVNLAEDEGFDPVEFFRGNPWARQDAESMQKLTDVYKTRQQKPFNYGKVAVEAAKAAPGAVVSFGRGIVKAAGNVGTLLGADNGRDTNIYSDDPKVRAQAELSQAKKEVKAAGELAAATDVANTGISGLAQRAFRSTPTNDSGWALQLVDEANQRDAEQGAIQGRGTVASALVKTAAREGDTEAPQNVQQAFEQAEIPLDTQTIADISNVTDLTNLLPAGAALKSIKIVGTGIQLLDDAGKILATVTKGSKAYQAVADAARLAKVAVQDTLGKAVSGAGRVLGKTARELNAARTGLLGGALSAVSAEPNIAASAIGAGLSVKVAEKIGDSLVVAGKQLRGELPPGRLYKAASALYNSAPVQGAVRGAGHALAGDLPTAAITGLQIAGAQNEEQLGQALGSQLGLGAAIGGTGSTVNALAPYADVTGQIFNPTKTAAAPIDSPAYNSQPGLDAAHTRGSANLSPEVKNRIDQFREAVRGTGTEIYALSPDDYGRALVDDAQLRRPDEPLTDDEIGSILSGQAGTKGVYIANAAQPGGGRKKVILLNSDGSAFQHEGGHLLDALLPDSERTALRNEARKRYTPEELADFKKDYEERLGQPITQAQLFDEIIAENISAVLNAAPIETLGTPAPVARKIYQTVGKFFETVGFKTGKRTALDLRPDIGLGQLAENLIRAQQSETIRPVRVGETPAGDGAVKPVRGSRSANDNIRVTRQDQNRFAGAPENESPESRSVQEAQPIVAASKSLTPVQKTAFARIGDEILNGNGRPRPVELDYDSVRSDVYDAGKKTRKTERDAGYLKEALGALPEDVRQQVQKVIIPERFVVDKVGDVHLYAKSVDKVISNAYRLTREAEGKNVNRPYETKGAELTENGWRDLVKDIQTYTANQANGYTGSGKKITTPANYPGFIPPENSAFTPRSLDESKANFINMLMALPPQTSSRVGKTGTGVPVPVSAQRLASANNRPGVRNPLTSDKNQAAFKAKTGQEILEFNPLREEYVKAGVDVTNLSEATEQISLANVKGEPVVREDLNFSRPSTDLIRAGFMPDSKKAVRVGDENVHGVADEYMAKTGRDYTPFTGYAQVDENVAKRIADYYDKAKSNLADPEVQTAYRALVDETKAQYEQMVADGYQIEPYTGQGEPYKNSAEAVADVRDNKHLYFLKTEGNFGTDSAAQAPNALLEPSGIEVDGVPLLNNDLFRAVHDFFGHAKEGYEFGPRGEYNAFLAHSTMFSDAALPALAAETLAQNSWVNYGPHLRDEAGNIPKKGDPAFVPLTKRPFAEQKNIALPKELIGEAFNAAGIERGEKGGDVAQKSFKPGNVPQDLAAKYPEQASQTPEDHTLVEIRRPDGSTYAAATRGYWELPGQEPRPSVGRFKNGGVSHGFLYDGETITSPYPSFEEWQNAPQASFMPNKKQIESPEFKSWFGESKVVDENGKPKVVYHGTAGDIASFDKEKRGENTGARSAKEAFFFVNDPAVASGYANTALNLGGDDNPNLVPVYLALENPLVHDFEGKSYRERTYADLITQAKKDGHDGAIFKNTIDPGDQGEVVGKTKPDKLKWEDYGKGQFYDSENFSILYDSKNKKQGKVEKLPNGLYRVESGFNSGIWDLAKTREEAAQIVQDNYERSFQAEDIHKPYEPHDIYAVFEPEQIKSATGNSGAFNPDDPRIAFMPDAQRPSKPLPHSIGEGKITLLHRGANGYKTVDPKFFGKSGITPRSELSGENRSYFYEEGHENTGDITMGRGEPQKVEVYKNRIYDADEDALEWAHQINRWKADSDLIKRGYVGVFRSRPLGRGKRFHQIELFYPTRIKSD